MKFEDFREMAMSFAEATEAPHFEKISFRVNKKIFATYDIKHHRACLILKMMDQDVYSLVDRNAIYPVPNKWGNQGWTFFELENTESLVMFEALKSAYIKVAPIRLSKEWMNSNDDVSEQSK